MTATFTRTSLKSVISIILNVTNNKTQLSTAVGLTSFTKPQLQLIVILFKFVHLYLYLYLFWGGASHGTLGPLHLPLLGFCFFSLLFFVCCITNLYCILQEECPIKLWGKKPPSICAVLFIPYFLVLSSLFMLHSVWFSLFEF